MAVTTASFSFNCGTRARAVSAGTVTNEVICIHPSPVTGLVGDRIRKHLLRPSGKMGRS